jgi:dynein heavy chain, axonemal
MTISVEKVTVYMLFIDRGLFEKDKLVFSFMLCVEIMKINSQITEADWNYFIRGAAGVPVDIPPKPDVPWLLPWQWNEACTLGAVLPAFKGLARDLTATPVWIQSGSTMVSLK